MLLETSSLSLRGGCGSGWTSPAAWFSSSCLFIWLAVRQPPVRLCGRFCTSVNVGITSFYTRSTYSLFFLSQLSPCSVSGLHDQNFPFECEFSLIYWFTILSWRIDWPLILALITYGITKTSQPHLAFLSQGIADAFEMSVMVKLLSGALCSVTFFFATVSLFTRSRLKTKVHREAGLH